MEDSILTSTKKILGLTEDYTAFDLEILTHINAAFSVVDQLGVGTEGGHFIADETANWSDLTIIPPNQLNLLKSYVFLKVKSLFDPPDRGFLIEAMEKQILEFEYRLRSMKEFTLPDPIRLVVVEEPVI